MSDKTHPQKCLKHKWTLSLLLKKLFWKFSGDNYYVPTTENAVKFNWTEKNKLNWLWLWTRGIFITTDTHLSHVLVLKSVYIPKNKTLLCDNTSNKINVSSTNNAINITIYQTPFF